MDLRILGPKGDGEPARMEARIDLRMVASTALKRNLMSSGPTLASESLWWVKTGGFQIGVSLNVIAWLIRTRPPRGAGLVVVAGGGIDGAGGWIVLPLLEIGAATVSQVMESRSFDAWLDGLEGLEGLEVEESRPLLIST